MSAIETKLAAARTRLILDKPFLGALVLRLPLTAADGSWCPTTATDARRFYYNAEYIDALSLDQTQFVLAHEALHCALSHFARRQHRVKHRWDLACDFAVNPLLVDDGLTPPPNAVVMDQYKGMTAEEIYPLLDDNDETETLDEHVYDREQDQGGSQGQTPPPRQDDTDQGSRPDEGGEQERNAGGGESEDAEQSGGGSPELDERADSGSGAGAPQPQPPPLTPDERETLAVQWQQRMAGAAQQAMQSDKLSGALARMIDHLLQPQLPWRMLLARYMSTAARDDFSYMRPSRREGTAIFPSLRSGQIDLVIGLDTSGSIRDSEIEEFIAEVDALKGQVRARVTLLPCDANLAEGAPWIYEPWEEIGIPESIRGGGGTSFRPVFDWVQHTGLQPELLVYFTDAAGVFPEREPPYPVIWLVKGKEKVPWGQRVQLN
jgi:predicted metal-dependent peptidase